MRSARAARLLQYQRMHPEWEDVAGNHRDRTAEHAAIAAATREWLRARGFTQVPRERPAPPIPVTFRRGRWCHKSKPEEEVA